MIAKIINWVSRVCRLVLISRTAFVQLQNELEDVKEVLTIYRATIQELSKINTETNESLTIATDRLEMIAANEALTNGTARKLTAIASETLEEIYDRAEKQA